MRKIIINRKTDTLTCPIDWTQKNVKGCVTCDHCFGVVSHSHVNCKYRMPPGPRKKM